MLRQLKLGETWPAWLMTIGGLFLVYKQGVTFADLPSFSMPEFTGLTYLFLFLNFICVVLGPKRTIFAWLLIGTHGYMSGGLTSFDAYLMVCSLLIFTFKEGWFGLAVGAILQRMFGKS